MAHPFKGHNNIECRQVGVIMQPIGPGPATEKRRLLQGIYQ